MWSAKHTQISSPSIHQSGTKWRKWKWRQNTKSISCVEDVKRCRDIVTHDTYNTALKMNINTKHIKVRVVIVLPKKRQPVDRWKHSTRWCRWWQDLLPTEIHTFSSHLSQVGLQRQARILLYWYFIYRLQMCFITRYSVDSRLLALNCTGSVGRTLDTQTMHPMIRCSQQTWPPYWLSKCYLVLNCNGLALRVSKSVASI